MLKRILMISGTVFLSLMLILPSNTALAAERYDYRTDKLTDDKNSYDYSEAQKFNDEIIKQTLIMKIEGDWYGEKPEGSLDGNGYVTDGKVDFSKAIKTFIVAREDMHDSIFNGKLRDFILNSSTYSWDIPVDSTNAYSFSGVYTHDNKTFNMVNSLTMDKTDNACAPLFNRDKIDKILDENGLSGVEFIANISVPMMNISIIYASDGKDEYFIPFMSVPKFYPGYESGGVYTRDDMLKLFEPLPPREGEILDGDAGGIATDAAASSPPSSPDATIIVIACGAGVILFSTLILYRIKSRRRNLAERKTDI